MPSQNDFFDAILKDDDVAASAMIAENPKFATSRGRSKKRIGFFEMTPLMGAAIACRPKCFAMLLPLSDIAARRRSTGARGEASDTIALAARKDQAEMVCALLAESARTGQEVGWADAIRCAAGMNATRALEALLAHAQTQPKGPAQEAALLALRDAAAGGWTDSVKMLVAATGSLTPTQASNAFRLACSAARSTDIRMTGREQAWACARWLADQAPRAEVREAILVGNAIFPGLLEELERRDLAEALEKNRASASPDADEAGLASRAAPRL
jgi:hypothetical protein